MSARDALRSYAEILPAGTVVPVPRELLLEILAGEVPETAPASPARDLTVDEVAAHFHRSPGTVRTWLEAGRFEGAYKLRGRSWRVPPAAITAFVERERRPEPSTTRARGAVVALDAWRRTG